MYFFGFVFYFIFCKVQSMPKQNEQKESERELNLSFFFIKQWRRRRIWISNEKIETQANKSKKFIKSFNGYKIINRSCVIMSLIIYFHFRVYLFVSHVLFINILTLKLKISNYHIELHLYFFIFGSFDW